MHMQRVGQHTNIDISRFNNVILFFKEVMHVQLLPAISMSGSPVAAHLFREHWVYIKLCRQQSGPLGDFFGKDGNGRVFTIV